VQDIIYGYIKPFLHIKHRTGIGIGKGSFKNSNRGYAYVNRCPVLAEGLDTFKLGDIATGRKMNPSKNLSIMRRNLGWINV
jgi:hypothetical protein